MFRLLIEFVFNSLGTTVSYTVAVLINLSNLSLVDVKIKEDVEGKMGGGGDKEWEL